MTWPPLSSRSLQSAGAAFLVLLLFGHPPTAPSVPRGRDASDEGKQFNDRLLKIAQTYQTYGRVDDQGRWAPWMCAAPQPATVRFSASRDAKTHGQKLYSLFAFSRNSYLIPPKAGQPVGQVIVKQAWIPTEVKEIGKPQRAVIRQEKAAPEKKKGQVHGFGSTDFFLPYARKDGRIYKADKLAALFIMYKMEPTTAGTDRGWVYGTVTPDGKTVTSAGKVASCMKCHLKAPGDRVFGLSWANGPIKK